MSELIEPIKWHPSPEPFDCECGKAVTERDMIMWLQGIPQGICIDCALKVLRDHLEVMELEKMYNSE